MDDVLNDQSALVRSIIRRKFSCSAALAIIVYEYVTTFRDELQYIWRAQCNAVKVAYLFSRYYALLFQSVNVYFIFRQFSVPNVSESTCKTWFAVQAASCCLLLAVLDFILMLRIYALYQKHVGIGLFLVFLYTSMIFIDVVVGPQTIYNVPFDLACDTKETHPGVLYFGIAVWILHLILGILTIFKYKLTIMGVPIAKLVTRDGVWVLGAICVLFAVTIPYSMTIQVAKADTAFVWPVSVFSISCCRIIMNMQAFGDSQGRDIDAGQRSFNNLELAQLDSVINEEPSGEI